MSVTGTRLIELTEELADTPTLTAYVSTERARRRGGTHGEWRAEVAMFLDELRCRCGDILARRDRDIFERNLRRLELRLRGLPQAVRAAGWFVIVARGDVHYCAPVPCGGTSEARWQRGPWLPPLVSPPAIASHERAFLLTPAQH